MGRGDTYHTIGQTGVELCHKACVRRAASADFCKLTCVKAELLEHRRIHACRRYCGIGDLLQRRCAPHKCIGEMNRYVGNALDSAAGRR